MDLIKMAREARKAQNQAKSVEEAGVKDSASMLVNGLIDIVGKPMVNVDILMQRAKISEEHRDLVKKISDVLADDFVGAFNDGKKRVTKKMQESMGLEDLKKMFSQ